MSTSLAVAVSASFFGHTIPLGIFGFFAEIEFKIFRIVSHKPVLSGLDITFTKF